MTDQPGPESPYPASIAPYALGEPIPGQVEQFGRILDPVRAAALAAAVRLKSVIPVPSAEEVIALAEVFEAYLDPPEEDQP
jgi:hypothetical protein